MPSQKLTFKLLPNENENENIYCLTGPLVLENMFAFQEILRSESGTTILELTDVPYMDSAGLGVLTNSYVAHQKHGRKLLLVGVNERIQALFELTTLNKLFEIFPTVEIARANKAA